MASIQKRDSGRWRARYRDDAGKEHARHFDRKIDAQRWLDEVTADKLTGRYADPRRGSVTFAEFMRQWMAVQPWKPRTLVGAELVRKSVPFGDVALNRLTVTHLEAWRRQMELDGLAVRTINNRLRTVRSALKSAVADRRIAENPATHLKFLRVEGSVAEVRIPSPEDVRALLEASEPRMRAFVALCAFAGLRRGEASAVRVDDIDFLRRVLRVRWQVQARPGGPPEVREPKYGSIRDVYLPDELLTMLSQHIEHHGVASAGWLFFSGSGPIAPSTVNSWWMRTREAAGIDVDLHGLRHFYASGLIADGCDVVTVQRALGHSKPSITLDTYSHLWPTAEDKTRSAASAMMASLRNAPRNEAPPAPGAPGVGLFATQGSHGPAS